MEKEFIPYEQALALKELGFDEPCFAYFYHHQEYKILFDNPNQARDYNYIKIDVDSIFDHDKEKVKKGLESLGDSVSRLTSVPLYQQAFRWFREKYDLVCIITFDDDVKGKWFGNLYGHYETHGKYDFGYTELFKTYEEAELECLKKLIKIIKNK
jgi:hypothetical protein